MERRFDFALGGLGTGRNVLIRTPFACVAVSVAA
jgi:hypothetical protein